MTCIAITYFGFLKPSLVGIRHFIGVDLSLGLEYRPLLNDNVQIIGGVAGLLPGEGFRDLYNRLDEPASDFVMGFLGEVTRLNGVNLRPHDIDVATEDPGTTHASPGYVSRVLRIGFEVRVFVLTEAGDEVVVQLTKTHADALGVRQDAQVWLTPVAGATVVSAEYVG